MAFRNDALSSVLRRCLETGSNGTRYICVLKNEFLVKWFFLNSPGEPNNTLCSKKLFDYAEKLILIITKLLQ